MKVNKKIYILILTGIYIFFISIFNVKALSYSVQVNQNSYIESFTSGGEITKTKNLNVTGLLGNHLNGFVFFNLGVGGPIEIYSVRVYVDNTPYACDTGTATTYNDNNEQRIFMGVSCPVDIPNGTSLSKIEVRGYGGNPTTSKYIFWPQTITYYSYYMESSNTQNIQNDTNDIKNKMNEDIDNNSKTAPDQTQYNNAKQQEENIIQSISNVSANDITFSQDLQASNKIWDTTTRFLNTNAKVMGLVISILSIGIIKLIMNR